eukprot:CAMPEP_0118912176 /NCGR_PEP_ID=MMETSP1166-20130328/13545_1 /TAXON_ID=1104430 /ORGANISM="Chrysoreinhardia sp, Strain CCMP3193" /LENGTH=273 /DNA_ID=CAMNT_0006851691 /DNA_START=30 /DNA_END=848 /DNA_ORIENTATION=+
MAVVEGGGSTKRGATRAEAAGGAYGQGSVVGTEARMATPSRRPRRTPRRREATRRRPAAGGATCVVGGAVDDVVRFRRLEGRRVCKAKAKAKAKAAAGGHDDAKKKELLPPQKKKTTTTVLLSRVALAESLGTALRCLNDEALSRLLEEERAPSMLEKTPLIFQVVDAFHATTKRGALERVLDVLERKTRLTKVLGARDRSKTRGTLLHALVRERLVVPQEEETSSLLLTTTKKKRRKKHLSALASALVRRGVDPLAVDATGRSALQLAARAG